MTGRDVTAALGWLRVRGIRVDPSYAHAIRNHRRDAPAPAPERGRWAA